MKIDKDFYTKQKKISKTHKHFSLNDFMLCGACWFVAETNRRLKDKSVAFKRSNK